MSLGHSEASFNHSCLKVPVDSSSRRPIPKYERLSVVKNSGTKDFQVKKDDHVSDLYGNFKSVKSYLQFYESIPDYSELNHLSNEEFYSRLKSLKITQKRFCSESNVLDPVDVNENSANDNKPFSYRSFASQNNSRKSENKKDITDMYLSCSLLSPRKDNSSELNNIYDKKNESKMVEGVSMGVKQSPPKINIISDNENASDLLEPELKKHSGYEADQESSTLMVGEKPMKNLRNYSVSVGDEYLLGSCSRRSRSLPISPGCECETPEFCHRFSDCSFRYDSCHSRIGSGYWASEKEKQYPAKKPKKVRPVPLTSRIPLFDKIMMEKEARRRIMHDRYSEELRSLVKPFSFTEREERERHSMICSNPELTSLNPPLVRFKAKPIPKNLFSNYAYERMKEDEFYRALKRRIRAEEMLKASSLPPSMALREKKFRSKSLDFLDYRSPKKSWNKSCGYRRTCQSIRKEIEYDQKNKCPSPQKRKLKSPWMSSSSLRRINSATDSSTEISPYESVLGRESRRKARPHSAFSTGRNNLASVLRIKTARNRLEKEMEEKLRENRLKNETRFKERLVRMTPAWRAISCDKDEDLALRVAARREEERRKKEKHQMLMESIYGRVYRMPPLFHRARFLSAKNSRRKGSSVGKDSNFSYNDPIETQKTDEACGELEETQKDPQTFGLPDSTGHEDNCRSRGYSESTASGGDKSEKAKAYESDDMT